MVWRINCGELDFYLQAKSAEEAIKIFKSKKTTKWHKSGYFYTITAVIKVDGAEIIS